VSTPVLILQHPKESRMPIGTARMAAHALSAQLVVGLELEDDPHVRAALDDPDRQAVLLWPKDAADLDEALPDGPLTLIVVDGTWSLAKKLVRLNPRIAALPRVAFRPPRPSEYRIRREPSGECVSTVEAIMYALAAIERDGRTFEELLAPFRFMVDRQIDHQSRLGHGRARPAPKPRRRFALPEPLRREEDLVLVVGEANAWPFADPRRRENPDELVHWLALRLSDGAELRLVVRPTRTLCPRTSELTELDAEQILAGVDRPGFEAAWRAFVRPTDVVVGWGYHALSLLAEPEKAGLEFFDLRTLVKDWSKLRPGTVERFAAELGVTAPPRGPGRGGRRLALMAAVLDHVRAQSVYRRQRKKDPTRAPSSAVGTSSQVAAESSSYAFRSRTT
jgi:DTW domain-containing protein